MQFRYKIYVALFIAGIFVGILGYWLLRGSDAASVTQIRLNSSEYSYINPLLFSDSPRSETSFSKNINKAISDVVARATKEGRADSISVYFRDLNTSQWTGFNEDALYKPSSMLKVLAMMAALKEIEKEPRIASEKLMYRRAISGGAYYEGDKTTKDGMYSVSDLIKIMVTSSDNDAFLAIVSNKQIDQEFVKIYNFLRLPPAGLTGSASDFMSPKSYAALFRTLYNSTFFSWGVSEQTLELLSRTNFNDGLVAGVPKGTVVAHKFGENLDQLHDCGIVYYPEHPYLLCVMTKGSDLSKLKSVISGVSKSVYDTVHELYN